MWCVTWPSRYLEMYRYRENRISLRHPATRPLFGFVTGGCSFFLLPPPDFRLPPWGEAPRLDSLAETRDSSVMADLRGSLKKSKKPPPG